MTEAACGIYPLPNHSDEQVSSITAMQDTRASLINRFALYQGTTLVVPDDGL